MIIDYKCSFEIQTLVSLGTKVNFFSHSFPIFTVELCVPHLVQMLFLIQPYPFIWAWDHHNEKHRQHLMNHVTQLSSLYWLGFHIVGNMDFSVLPKDKL